MSKFQILVNRILGESDGHRIIKNIGWLFFDKVIRLGLNFCLTAYIARYLGVTNFGFWNYAIAFVALFSFMSTLGLYQLLLRDFVKNPDKKFELLRNAFAIKLVGGTLTFLISFAVAYLFKSDSDLTLKLILIIGLGYIVQSLDVIDYFFQSQLKSHWIALSRALSFTVFSLIKLYLIYLHQPLIYFVWAQIGELFLGGLFLLFYFQKNFKGELFWQVRYPYAKEILLQSVPILLAEIAIIFYMRIDQIMIGEMLGNSALGIYSAAVKLSEIWYLFPGIICSSLFPSIIHAHSKDPITYKKKLQRLYDILAWLSLGIGLIVSIFSKSLIELVYGVEYIAASDILVIHVWSGLFVFWGTASSQQLVIENLMKISFYRTLFGLVANIVLNLLLIPVAGPSGSAIATLISYAFSAWISNLFFESTRSIFWMNLWSINPIRIFRLRVGRKSLED